ncbi:phage tail protein [Acinetobacter baumannii]|uniref:phage tail protein n=1 Tax=Acinetobacter baumannii TaxID=470 RepID=UPI0025A5F38C|nr:phage tail protein [Acinetobacter baumannii]MDM8395976.1 phage tail protein [Acinetobacter baumannii]MDR9625248.1 phage tail protein [Acinetobacter baumannii]
MGGIFGSTTISTSDNRINSMRVQQSAYGLCQPLVYGKNRVAANMFWYGDFSSTAHTTTTKSGGKGGKTKTSNTTYTYSASLMLGLCETKIRDIGNIWRDKEQIVPKTEGGVQLKPIDQLGFELFDGDQNPVWGYLASMHPDQAVHYPFLGYIACANYDLGGSASLSNHNFEVISDITFSDTIHDANPADVIEDFITNPRYGAAPSLNMADLSEFRTYCAATNLLISPALTEQRAAHEIINEIVEAVNCAIVPSPDGLKIRSYGDTAVSGNGVTFTPDLTPAYHLTDDDFIGDDQPVRVKRSRDTDAFNHCQIEYVNRFNQYNTETVEAKDQANIEMFGLRTQDPVKYDFFCEPKIARHAVQLLLQRKLYVRNEYEFDLGWKYCRLEPMDIVTLTDESLGLDRFPVRITRIEEDQDGLLTVTAEELALGSRSAVEYDLQASNGYQGGNEEPGNVNAPVIFEPPLDLTDGKNQVWVAASGGSNWGGCNVWASLDNTTYEMIGTIYGSARYGQLVAAINASETAMQVQLNTSSQIFSGTSEDAQVNTTLCRVGDEYVSYVDATLNGSGLYTLGGVLRGRFDDALAHNAGESFVRIDKAIFQHEFNSNLIDKTIYLKFTSFNGLQQKEQTLDEVTAYSHTLNGGRPSGVKGLSLQSPFVGSSFKVQWQFAAGAQGYIVQVLSGSTLLRTIETTSAEYTYSMEEAKVDGVQRNYTIRVASKSENGTSTFTDLNISNPVPPILANVYTSATSNSITVSWIPSEVPDLKDYQVWISKNASFDPETLAASWTGTENACTIGNLDSTTTYYIRVAARDVWKPTSWNYSARVTQATLEA